MAVYILKILKNHYKILFQTNFIIYVQKLSLNNLYQCARSNLYKIEEFQI